MTLYIYCIKRLILFFPHVVSAITQVETSFPDSQKKKRVEREERKGNDLCQKHTVIVTAM